MPIPQLDTRGMNLRRGTMAGVATVGQQNRNALLAEELESRPEQREQEAEAFQMAKDKHSFETKVLFESLNASKRKKVAEELNKSATLLASVMNEETYVKAFDQMIKDGRSESLDRLGLKRDGYSPDVIAGLRNYVAGQQGILKQIELDKQSKLETQKSKAASALETQKSKSRSALQTQADKAAMERKKLDKKSGGSGKEDPVKKDLRDRYQSVKSELRRLQSNVDQYMPAEEKKDAVKDAKKELEIIEGTFKKKGWDLAELSSPKATDPDNIRDLLFK